MTGHNYLLEAFRARSRSSWNERFVHWERPASDSEEQQIDRAARMVRSALSENAWLTNEGVTVVPQGSYYNNTNVRLEADMDLRVVHPLLKIEYADNVVIDSARTILGISDSGITFANIFQNMRYAIIDQLIQKFESSSVDITGNKAIRLKKQVGTRADVDIVPALRYYWVSWNPQLNRYDVVEGVAILGQNGRWTIFQNNTARTELPSEQTQAIDSSVMSAF
jgi:hypothetical protein